MPVRDLMVDELLKPINRFLMCETPDEWVVEASKKENLPVVLLDHLMCELKAAQNALYCYLKTTAYGGGDCPLRL